MAKQLHVSDNVKIWGLNITSCNDNEFTVQTKVNWQKACPSFSDHIQNCFLFKCVKLHIILIWFASILRSHIKHILLLYNKSKLKHLLQVLQGSRCLNAVEMLVRG